VWEFGKYKVNNNSSTIPSYINTSTWTRGCGYVCCSVCAREIWEEHMESLDIYSGKFDKYEQNAIRIARAFLDDYDSPISIIRDNILMLMQK
jgi:hypothetical protein